MFGPKDLYALLNNPRWFLITSAAFLFLLAVAWTSGNVLPVLARGTAGLAEAAGAESPQIVGTVLVAPMVFAVGIGALVVIRLAT
jgi:hypothetical protein